MSRETDNSSSGPQGAYPSGTPPYGTPAPGAAPGADGADAQRQAAGGASPALSGTEGAPAQQRKTETRLTTRVRINIPGSRPIPPVVMRTPMSDLDGPEASSAKNSKDAKGKAGGGAEGGPGAPGAAGSADPATGGTGDGTGSGPAGTGPGGQEQRTSDWFAPPPRKAGTARGGASSGSTDGAGTSFDTGASFGAGTGADTGLGAGAGTGPGTPFDTGSGTAFDTAFDTASRPGYDTGRHAAPGLDTGSDPSFGADAGAGTGPTTSAGLPRRSPDHQPGSHGAGDYPERGGFADPTPSGGTPIDPSSGAPRPGGTPPPPSSDGADGPPRSGLYDLFGDLPTDEPTGTHQVAGTPGVAPGSGDPGTPGAGGGYDPGTPHGPGHGSGSFEPSGGAMATGPATGAGRGPRDSDLAFFPEDGARPGPAGPTGGPVTGDSALPTRHGTGAGAGPAAGPQGADRTGPLPRMSDDTAELTPVKPARGPEENVSGHTVTSGIPVVPANQGSPFGGSGEPSGPPESALTHTPPRLPEPSPTKSSPKPAAAPPKKKGGNKLVLLGAGLVVVAGGAYGAGLLVGHSDVPKGTTVLGVDIGGGTRDEAVKKLDAAFGENTKRTLPLSVAGRTVTLKPDQAGLALDMDATVQAAAERDYNPVTVIGSLFGGTRVVQPVMPVDEEKLQAALQRAGGGVGSAVDGTIKFEKGRAVAVYGKAGKGIDTARSTKAVEQGYQTLVEKGHVDPVRVPLTERKPTVSDSEVDRMMREFAVPAMSGIVKIRAGDREIPFGPDLSLPQILGVRAVNGKLVDTYDRAAVKRLYGNTFDGILITRANGEKTPVQPEDVIGVMRKALLGKSAQERIGVIDLNPN